MNKNTRRSRKLGLTNNPEITIGSGAGRTIGTRHAEEIFSGSCCNTARKNKNKWIGALNAEQMFGRGKDS